MIEDELSFEVFPNLITDTVATKIRLTNNTSTGQKQGTLAIYNIMGQELYNEPLPIPAGRSDVTINTAQMQLASGVYFVVVEAEGVRLSRKLIVR